MKPQQPEKDLESLLQYLLRTRGFDFPAYKRQSLTRRVTKRMQMINTESFADYIDYLEVHPEEFSGRSEMLLTHTNLFSPIELKHRIFSKVPKVNMRDRLILLAQAGNVDVGNHIGRQLRLREIAFDASPLAHIVVDAGGNLALVNERARSLFNLKQRDIGKPIQDLEISYRPADLQPLIGKCVSEQRAVKLSDVERVIGEGKIQYMEIESSPIMDNGTMLSASITFNDRTGLHELQEEVHRHEQEIETAYEELQSANEGA